MMALCGSAIASPPTPRPKCGKAIHARKTSHNCGWVTSNGAPAASKPVVKAKNGRRKKRVHDQLGAEKVGAGE
jgi:hypothetical protein